METWNGKMKNEDEWEYNWTPMFDDMVEMVGEWKNDSEKWWEMVEHEMDMLDDMMDGKNEAINLASCLVTTHIPPSYHYSMD